jgi:glucose/arabinose dehydrogenase
LRHRSSRSLTGTLVLAGGLAALAACAGGGATSASTPEQLPAGPIASIAPGGPLPTPTPVVTQPPPQVTFAPTAPPTSVPTPPPVDARLHVPAGFVANVIATVGGARELSPLPNGDLLVATGGSGVAIVPNADGPGIAGNPATFANLPDSPAQSVAFGGGFVFVATQYGVYRSAYTNGMTSGTFTKIASVRSGGVAPNSDGDVHRTSSVAVSGTSLYVGVGSSCNACTETDPTRATVQRMNLDGSGMTTLATRIRNAIAFAVDPSSGIVWAGGAGQDNLPSAHPFEFLDAVSSHAAPADYGWPVCEENHVAYTSGANCANTVAPAIEFPAYSTLIGAAFYPASQSGAYAFGAAWHGGLFVSAHGSWHTANGVPVDPPHVAFVPFSGSAPAHPVNWSDPTAQWNDFFTGFQDGAGNRIGRTTGLAVGPNGSLFVADDQTGHIYRIRPSGSATTGIRRTTR